jgi:hypothetical protein
MKTPAETDGYFEIYPPEGPSMPPPAWMNDGPKPVRLEESGGREFEYHYVPDWEEFLSRVRDGDDQRFSIPGWLFVKCEKTANFRGQTEGFAVGLGLGILLAWAVYLSR